MKLLIYKIYGNLPRKIQKNLLKIKYFFEDFSKIEPKNRKVKKTIIVLGMHRSGTSLTANILKELGVNVGKTLLKESEENKKGFFENKLFLNLNNHLLARLNSFWDSPPSEKKINKLKKSKKVQELIKKIIKSEQDKIWGWKDPRTSLFIELYYPYLKNPSFIHCKRNSLSIAKSLQKRNNFNIKKGLKLNKEYNKRIIKFLNKIRDPILEINYEEIIEKPKENIEKIKNFLKIKSNKKIKIVDKRLKHN